MLIIILARKMEAMHQIVELYFTLERVLSIQRMTYARDICMREICILLDIHRLEAELSNYR